MPALGARGTSANGFFGGRSRPDAPIITQSVAGLGLLNISFTLPLFNGGLTITKYEYALSTDGTNWSAWFTAASSGAPLTSPVVISGLTNGQPYYVKLRATNGFGISPDSNIWNTDTTPNALPAAPTITSIARGYRQLTVSFSAPTPNGGTAVTDYQYSTDSGASWASMGQSTTTDYVITKLSPLKTINLADFTSYGIRVRAVNSAGVGEHSLTVSSTTAGVPAAPTIGTITTSISTPTKVATPTMTQDKNNAYFEWLKPTVTGVTLSIPFTAGSNNASTITNYKYSTDNGATYKLAGTATSPISITTLSNGSTALSAGTIYDIKIRAVNTVGDGAESIKSSPTTRTDVTSYTVTVYNNRGTETSVAEIPGITALSYQRSHLYLASDFSIRVQARNDNGLGTASDESPAATGWVDNTGTENVYDSSCPDGCSRTITDTQDHTQDCASNCYVGQYCVCGAQYKYRTRSRTRPQTRTASRYYTRSYQYWSRGADTSPTTYDPSSTPADTSTLWTTRIYTEWANTATDWTDWTYSAYTAFGACDATGTWASFDNGSPGFAFETVYPISGGSGGWTYAIYSFEPTGWVYCDSAGNLAFQGPYSGLPCAGNYLGPADIQYCNRVASYRVSGGDVCRTAGMYLP